MKPEVSVIMPVYNAEEFIAKAIESILNQTYTNFELVMIIDCPTDGTLNIINQYSDKRIRIIYNKCNSGIAYSRNRGLSVSQGKYVALMDDDDISLRNRLEKQVYFLEENSDIDVLGGRSQTINELGKIINTSTIALTNPLYINAMLLFRNVLINGTVMMRKDFIDKYRLCYKDGCLGMEDFLFWIDCSKVGRITNLDEVLLLYRKSRYNETNKVRQIKSKERCRLYAFLQKYSLESSGIRLSSEKLLVINKVLAEVGGRCESEDEIIDFYEALKEVIDQAEKINCINKREIKIACRKLLGEKIGLCDWLWIK